MIEFKKKNDYKFWHSPFVLIFIFCIFMLFLFNVINLIKKERETSHKKYLALEEIENLRQREISLNKDILKLQTEEGKEEIIRERYQVAKEGEKMIIIIEDKDVVSSGKKEENIEHGFLNWVKKIFNN